MRTIIVDDERLARKELMSLLEKHQNIEVLAECSNANEAKIEIEMHKPDLVFWIFKCPKKQDLNYLKN